MSSTIPGDPEPTKVDITVITVRPGSKFTLGLIHAKPQYTLVRIDSMRPRGSEIYRMYQMKTLEDEQWVPLSTCLNRRIRALQNPPEACYLACLETHILLTHSLVFRAGTHLRVHTTQAALRLQLLAWVIRHNDGHLCTERIL